MFSGTSPALTLLLQVAACGIDAWIELMDEEAGNQRPQRDLEEALHCYFSPLRISKGSQNSLNRKGLQDYDVAQYVVDCMRTFMVEIPTGSKQFPDDPFRLESSHLDVAYGQERPAEQDFPTLNVIHKKTCLGEGFGCSAVWQGLGCLKYNAFGCNCFV